MTTIYSDYNHNMYQLIKIKHNILIQFYVNYFKMKKYGFSGHDVNFCSDLPHRASEIQFSLALVLLQLSLALENMYV